MNPFNGCTELTELGSEPAGVAVLAESQSVLSASSATATKTPPIPTGLVPAPNSTKLSVPPPF